MGSRLSRRVSGVPRARESPFRVAVTVPPGQPGARACMPRPGRWPLGPDEGRRSAPARRPSRAPTSS